MSINYGLHINVRSPQFRSALNIPQYTCIFWYCRSAWACYKDYQAAGMRAPRPPPPKRLPKGQASLAGFVVRGEQARELLQRQEAQQDRQAQVSAEGPRPLPLARMQGFGGERSQKYRRAGIESVQQLADLSDDGCIELARKIQSEGRSAQKNDIARVIKARDAAMSMWQLEIRKWHAARRERTEEGREEAGEARGEGAGAARPSDRTRAGQANPWDAECLSDGLLAEALERAMATRGDGEGGGGEAPPQAPPPFGAFDDVAGYCGLVVSDRIIGDVQHFYWSQNVVDYDARVTDGGSAVLKLDWIWKGLPDKVPITIQAYLMTCESITCSTCSYMPCWCPFAAAWHRCLSSTPTRVPSTNPFGASRPSWGVMHECCGTAF